MVTVPHKMVRFRECWIIEWSDYRGSTVHVYLSLSSTAMHTILKDILPPTVYFRFNPVINQNVPIDECDPRKLDQLVHLTEDFIEEYKYELRQVVDTLQNNKSTWMKLKAKSEELLQDIQLHLYHRIKL